MAETPTTPPNPDELRRQQAIDALSGAQPPAADSGAVEGGRITITEADLAGPQAAAGLSSTGIVKARKAGPPGELGEALAGVTKPFVAAEEEAASDGARTEAESLWHKPAVVRNPEFSLDLTNGVLTASDAIKLGDDLRKVVTNISRKPRDRVTRNEVELINALVDHGSRLIFYGLDAGEIKLNPQDAQVIALTKSAARMDAATAVEMDKSPDLSSLLLRLMGSRAKTKLEDGTLDPRAEDFAAEVMRTYALGIWDRADDNHNPAIRLNDGERDTLDRILRARNKAVELAHPA